MEQREQIEKAADRLRDELLLTLHELDRRRQNAFSLKAVKRNLQAHRRDLNLAALGAAVLVGSVIAVAYSRHEYQKRHSAELRLRALKRAWEHPDRLATKAPDRPVGELLARRVLVAGLATLGAQLGKRLVKNVLPAKG